MKLNLNNAYTLGGMIHSIGETEQIKDNFMKRKFIVNQTIHNQRNGDPYTEYVSFEVVNNNCSLLNDFKVGDPVNVKFNVKGNLWKEGTEEERAILTLQAYRIEAAEA